MSLLQNSNAIPQLGGFNLTDSLRFRSSASAYLDRTPSSASNRKTFTLSVWVKRSTFGTSHAILTVNAGQSSLSINNTDELAWDFTVPSGRIIQRTNAKLRDPSAWYHLVWAIDTTQATDTNRFKMYINGELQSTYVGLNTTGGGNYFTQNETLDINTTNIHNIGYRNTNNDLYFDGYMTEVNFIDGQQLTPSDFGEYDAITGVWKPKRYSGSRGTNGFYLPMKPTTQASGFNTVTYTGTGSSGTKITDVGFQPDLVWIKNRTNANNHLLVDSVRGADKTLESNTTNAETASTTNVSSFDADGFTLGSGANASNSSSYNYVGWCWEAGGTAVTNTNGTITSSVSANTAKGFSVLTYTGNGVLSTIGHGLSSAPDMIITKRRDAVDGWFTYHSALGKDEYLNLSSTSASGTTLPNYWGTSEPTSTVYGVNTYGGTNTNGGSFVSYCFSEVSGFSKFGSYTGTGSSGNAITGLGFKPAFLMIKRTDSTGNWIMVDNTRSPDNSPGEYLLADSSNAEGTTTIVDFDSDGFTVNATGSGSNASGGTYIYMAFADTRDNQFNFDASGNKNNWTPVNINSNASSDTTYDIMSDVPTLTDEDTGNFCTINPITCPEGTISNGNLTIDHNGSTGKFYLGTMGISSGKWYFEAKVLNMSSNSRHTIGFCKAHESSQSFQTYMGGSSSTYHCLFYSGAQYEGTTIARTISSLAQPASGTIINVAIDVDNNKVFFGKNGTWQNSGNPVTGTGQCINLAANTEWVLATGAADNSSNSTHNNDWDFNFGQQPFAYTPPTGFKKLNTYNLPDSAIKDGSKYFDTKLWTGNGTSQTISGLEFAPDLVWGKSRSTTGNHVLVDSIRGDNTNLNTNLTNAESTGSSISNLVNGSFDVAGGGVNASSVTTVGWAWRCSDSTAVSNTDGSITSTVSANTTSGFSVVTWTGTSTAGYVGHGLGVTPEVVICKARDTTTSFDNWYCYFKELGAANKIILDRTDAASATSTWDNTSPNSTGFYLRNSVMNLSPYRYVAYVFAPVEGFSKFGTYTGNGSTDGPFVYLGFRPAFVITKRTDSTGGWVILDSARDTYNIAGLILQTEGNYAEANVPYKDILSNGFKVKSSTVQNASSATYIYMAFASNPLKHSLAR